MRMGVRVLERDERAGAVIGGGGYAHYTGAADSARLARREANRFDFWTPPRF